MHPLRSIHKQVNKLPCIYAHQYIGYYQNNDTVLIKTKKPERAGLISLIDRRCVFVPLAGSSESGDTCLRFVLGGEHLQVSVIRGGARRFKRRRTIDDPKPCHDLISVLGESLGARRAEEPTGFVSS